MYVCVCESYLSAFGNEGNTHTYTHTITIRAGDDIGIWYMMVGFGKAMMQSVNKFISYYFVVAAANIHQINKMKQIR